MNYLRSQLWPGKARYFLVRDRQLLDPWAPYAQLDFAVRSVESVPNADFEIRAAFAKLTTRNQSFARCPAKASRLALNSLKR